MPGAYAFFNPPAEADRNIDLFYNTKRNNLALTLKASSGSDPGLNYAAQANNQPGVLIDKTELDSTIVNSLRLIVGLTMPAAAPGNARPECHCGGDPTNYDVSIVSPMYMPIASASTKSNAVAVCSDNQSAWLWYITGDDDNHRRLAFSIILQEGTATTVTGIPAILSGTSLVSIYSPAAGSPIVFFQGDDDDTLIYEYTRETNAAQPITSTNDSVPGTTMSLSLDESTNTLFLYYTDKSYKVRRISRDFGTLGAQWTGSRSVKAVTQAVSPASQLGVVPVQAQKINHIFYIPNNSPNLVFTHAKDPFSG